MTVHKALVLFGCLVMSGGCGEKPFSPSDQNQVVCGDGDVDPGETCDDGNSVAGDGCRPDCQVERCGDNNLDAGDACFGELLSFSGGGRFLHLADLGGDGTLDVVTVDDIEVRLAAADSFAETSTFVAESFGKTATGDFDGDGRADLAVVGFMSALYLGTSSPPHLDANAPMVLPDVGIDSAWVATGDLDGDGDLDLVVGGSPQTPGEGGLGILMGGGDGSFTSETRPSADLARVAVADVTGSAAPEVIALTLEGVITVWENLDGELANEPVSSPIDGLSVVDALAVGDVNGDGIADCIAGGSLRTVLALGTGDGSFIEHSQLMVGGTITRAFIADVNNDGHPDVVFSANGEVGYLTGDGTGAFGPRQIVLGTEDLGESYYPNDLQLGDVNGDGALDLVVAVIGPVRGLRVRLSSP